VSDARAARAQAIRPGTAATPFHPAIAATTAAAAAGYPR